MEPVRNMFGTRSRGWRRIARSMLKVVFLVALPALTVVLAGVLAFGLLFGDPSSEEVVEAFWEEGLEVSETRRIDRESDRSLLPKTYKEQTSFSIPSFGRNAAGRVYTFESREDLETVREHYEGAEGLFPSYVYDEGNVLVYIPGEVSEDEAERYAEILRKI